MLYFNLLNNYYYINKYNLNGNNHLLPFKYYKKTKILVALSYYIVLNYKFS